MASPLRRYRAGESLEDYCRACRNDRLHTVIAVDSDGRPLRVSCFHKIVMLRNRLRSLEQVVNAAELPDDMKVRH